MFFNPELEVIFTLNFELGQDIQKTADQSP